MLVRNRKIIKERLIATLNKTPSKKLSRYILSICENNIKRFRLYNYSYNYNSIKKVLDFDPDLVRYFLECVMVAVGTLEDSKLMTIPEVVIKALADYEFLKYSWCIKFIEKSNAVRLPCILSDNFYKNLPLKYCKRLVALVKHKEPELRQLITFYKKISINKNIDKLDLEFDYFKYKLFNYAPIGSDRYNAMAERLFSAFANYDSCYLLLDAISLYHPSAKIFYRFYYCGCDKNAQILKNVIDSGQYSSKTSLELAKIVKNSFNDQFLWYKTVCLREIRRALT